MSHFGWGERVVVVDILQKKKKKPNQLTAFVFKTI
jgi:hypothetical protein